MKIGIHTIFQFLAEELPTVMGNITFMVYQQMCLILDGALNVSYQELWPMRGSLCVSHVHQY